MKGFYDLYDAVDEAIKIGNRLVVLFLILIASIVLLIIF